MSQGPNKSLSLGLALAPMWPPSEGLAVDLDHEDDFSSIKQAVKDFILKKSLVLVASHAKCRSKLVMILHVIAVGWPIL